MTFTASGLTPAFLAEVTTLRPSAVSPSGSTGRVREIFRFGWVCLSRARACERREIDAESAVAAPSMSKSAYFAPYASTTAAYSV